MEVEVLLNIFSGGQIFFSQGTKKNKSEMEELARWNKLRHFFYYRNEIWKRN
jgi:hypothetical protein